MRSKMVSIWGRAFDLKISYDHYDDDTIPSDMAEARDRLFESWHAVDDSLTALKDYCAERNGSEIEQLEGTRCVDNIFRIAVPDCLFVLPSGATRRVALMLNYRFDPEEGLALLFENESLKTICPQSEVF